MTRLLVGLTLLAAGILWLCTLTGLHDFSGLLEQTWAQYAISICVALLGIHVLRSRRQPIDHGGAWRERPLPPTGDGILRLRALCAGHSYTAQGEPFGGAAMQTCLGGIRLDLSQAVFSHDCAIETQNCFGGCEIIVPKGVKVETESVSLIGGIGNHCAVPSDTTAVTLHVKARNCFGGVNITNSQTAQP